MIGRVVRRLLGLSHLDGLYTLAAAVVRRSGRGIYPTLTDILDVGLEVSEAHGRRIPAEGPVVVVANHPTGALDGIALAALLESVREDVRTLSHAWFQRYPLVAERMFVVDPAGGAKARASNAASLRAAATWLGQGHLLVVFPAGAVARPDRRTLRVTDPPWRPGLARLIRKTRATVLPVHIEGRNGLGYQLLSFVHPRLGVPLLIRELLRKRGRSLRARIGRPIAWHELPRGADNEALTGLLRARTFELASGPGGSRIRPESTIPGSAGRLDPLVPPGG